MHYRGELWVNYIDESTSREMLKVYSMFYDPIDKSFTLNTTERFPTEVWITRLQIFTSGATTPIAYDKTTYNYRILTDNGLTVKLDTDGANLINNPAANYFGITSYTPVRVAGSNLFYFGRRYYDPEIGVWAAVDPAGEFFSGYAYTGNPILYIDPNGLMTWKGVLGTIGMNIVGLGALYFTGGSFGFVGYWDDETGDVAVYGGGYSGAAYGGVARVNYKTGDYGLMAGVGHIAPIWGGGVQMYGNWNSGAFQLRGFGAYAPWGVGGPFNVYHSPTDGWGFSLDITKTLPMDPVPDWHRYRNTLNNNFENAPANIKDAENDPNWEVQPEYARSTHGGHIVVNGKGPNSGKQLVYDKTTGELIRGQFEGTYDYCPPGVSKEGHTQRDVIPWLLWGDMN